jgi:cytoskeletal protein RodZ
MAKKLKHKKRSLSFIRVIVYIIVGIFGLSIFMTLAYRFINPPLNTFNVNPFDTRRGKHKKRLG